MSDVNNLIAKSKKKPKLFSIDIDVLTQFEKWAKENHVNQSQTAENLLRDLMRRVAEDKKTA